MTSSWETHWQRQVLAELPGSVITIAAATGLPVPQVRRVLDKLHRRGTLRYSLASGTYALPGER